MSLLRTFVATPTFDIERNEITRSNVIDFGAPGLVQIFPVGARPAYSFTLKLEPLLKYAAEDLSAFHAFHQGGKSFMFNGMEYGAIENFHLFGEGDGTTTQFFLPNRWIGVNSFALQSRNQQTQATSLWSAAYSLSPNPGLVVFDTAVSSGHDIEAKYACQYRVRFAPDGFKVTEWARGIYRAQIELFEVLIF